MSSLREQGLRVTKQTSVPLWLVPAQVFGCLFLVELCKIKKDKFTCWLLHLTMRVIFVECNSINNGVYIKPGYKKISMEGQQLCGEQSSFGKRRGEKKTVGGRH